MQSMKNRLYSLIVFECLSYTPPLTDVLLRYQQHDYLWLQYIYARERTRRNVLYGIFWHGSPLLFLLLIFPWQFSLLPEWSADEWNTSGSLQADSKERRERDWRLIIWYKMKYVNVWEVWMLTKKIYVKTYGNMRVLWNKLCRRP